MNLKKRKQVSLVSPSDFTEEARLVWRRNSDKKRLVKSEILDFRGLLLMQSQCGASGINFIGTKHILDAFLIIIIVRNGNISNFYVA